MKYCPECKKEFSDNSVKCPFDRTDLEEKKITEVEVKKKEVPVKLK